MWKKPTHAPALFVVLGLLAGCATKTAEPVAAAAPAAPAADPGMLLDQVKTEATGPVDTYVKGTADSIDALLHHARGIDLAGGIEEDDRLHAEAIAELMHDHPEIEVVLQPAASPATDPALELALQIIGWAETLEVQQALVAAGAPAQRVDLVASGEALDESWSRLDYTADEGVKLAFRRNTFPSLAYDLGDNQ